MQHACPILSLIFTGEGEKRGRETGKKLPEDPKEAGQGISISICYWILLFGVGILKKGLVNSLTIQTPPKLQLLTVF